MSLTANQVRLVTDSYTVIGRSPRPYSELFYHRLFLSHPFARALFPDDMTHQTIVFEKTIDVLVHNVADIDRLKPTLSNLARKHLEYGVKAYQYEAVGAVLIDTFSEILGSRFTPEVRKAWESVYAETAGVMISAAYFDD
ncbi:globin domain-containing protein [Sphingomonas sp. M1A8_2b]